MADSLAALRQRLNPEDQKLLARLDVDRERAGEKYEDLRRTLIKFFEWRGAPFPEDQTDETLNRVARKLDEGVEVKNLGGYCYEVARHVLLEVWKGSDSRRDPLDEGRTHTAGAAVYAAGTDDADRALERELLLECLDECLGSLAPESRALIVEYYQDERRDRIERRKALADALGLRRDALANRAQRLRDKLEQCVKRCSGKKRAI
jgi:DNA-directed RNA polymerase specialized sigma24 family protein